MHAYVYHIRIHVYTCMYRYIYMPLGLGPSSDREEDPREEARRPESEPGRWTLFCLFALSF